MNKATPIPPFQEFLDDTRRIVYRFLLGSVGPADADDCFQETFLAALRGYPKLRDGSNLRGWVLAIATRKAIDAARARARGPMPLAEVPDRQDRTDPGLPATVNPLWDAVRDLPAKQRVAVVHRVVLDRTYADVGRAMDTTEEAARANVHQALKRLRREVGER